MKDHDIDLWAIDEVHFQQHGSRCVMWIPPEVKDPVLMHAPARKGIGYSGAVRLRDGFFVYRRETGRFNAETLLAFLKRLHRASSAAGRRVIVIADNAQYHHARHHKDWRARQADGFALDFLPPYSPDLNPIERAWKLTRRLCTHNRYFTSLEDVTQAVEQQFEQWRRPNSSLRRLCAIT